METKMEQRSVAENERKKPKIQKFKATNDKLYTEYEIIVENGKIHYAACFGPRGRFYEWNGYTELDECAEETLRYIIKRIIFENDIEDLKRLYKSLDNTKIKNIVKSVQEELIEKLTF